MCYFLVFRVDNLILDILFDFDAPEGRLSNSGQDRQTGGDGIFSL